MTLTARAASLVVFSLERWGTVRRRIRILVDELVERDPDLHVLYVDPGRRHPLRAPSRASRRTVRAVPRAGPPPRPRPPSPQVAPPGPRAVGRPLARPPGRPRRSRPGTVDPLALGQRRPLRRLRRSGPAGPPSTTSPTTGSWPRSRARQEARLRADDDLLLERSGAVVVCSPDLARTRGRARDVDLIPNGVDVELFRTPQPRPAELPAVAGGRLRGHPARGAGRRRPPHRRGPRPRPDLRWRSSDPTASAGVPRRTRRRARRSTCSGPVPYDRVPASSSTPTWSSSPTR